jgi:hypothetical protein
VDRLDSQCEGVTRRHSAGIDKPRQTLKKRTAPSFLLGSNKRGGQPGFYRLNNQLKSVATALIRMQVTTGK